MVYSAFISTFALMNNKLFLSLLLTICGVALHADNPWKLRLENNADKVLLHIDLYEESVDVPGMELLGPMNGYLGGKGVYGVWMVTSFEIVDEKNATIRVSNDLGSETQQIKLTCTNDSTYQMELQNGVVVKKAVNRKLVKIPSKFEMKVKP